MNAPTAPLPPTITTKVQAKALDWHRVNVSVAVKCEPPPRKFIVAHLPAEKGIYGLLIGPDGARKSWLAMHIAAAVAGGKPVAGGLWPAPASGRVVFVTAEDSANEIWRRIHALSRLHGNEWVADIDDRMDIIPLPAGTDGLTLVQADPTNPRRFVEHPNVGALIDYCRDTRLIIIDPLADMVDASENDDHAASCVVKTLRRISRETGAGVIVIHHQNKAAILGGDGNNQTARGSSKIPAGARWSVTMQPLTEREAQAREIMDRERWTVVSEGKASYTQRDATRALYHYPEVTNYRGQIEGGVPLAIDLPARMKDIEADEKASAEDAYRWKKVVRSEKGKALEAAVSKAAKDEQMFRNARKKEVDDANW